MEPNTDAAEEQSFAEAMSDLGESLEDAEPEPQAEPEPEAEPATEETTDPEAAAAEEEEDETSDDPDVLRDQLASAKKDVAGLEKYKISLQREVKEAQARVSTQEALLQRVVSEVQSLRERLVPEETEEPTPFSEDPEEGVRRVVKEEMQPLLEHKEAREKEDDQKSFQAMTSDVVTYNNQTREDFAKEHPDYPEAAKWLTDQETEDRLADLQLAHPERDPEELRKHAQAWADQRVVQAHLVAAAKRTNLAERVYDRAVKRGWKPPEAESNSETETDPVLRDVSKGVKLARTPKRSGGAQPATKVTRKAVERMTDEQRLKWVEETPFEEVMEVAGNGIYVT